ncbi:hypothetical protein Ciccas_007448 [Cichlidogyrus casuarinus]|uniref:Trafficking protein particle complex subunit 13 middle domain-containing protein n=1 Tax=Cichlidogyrus casuarinus TaxID=1844966 RepID=A0ABD2Q310_9PLAT
MNFERHYKFSVLKPLEVKMTYHSKDLDNVFVQANVQNLTSSPINLERVVLEPASDRRVIDLNKGTDTAPLEQNMGILKPLATAQFLFHVQLLAVDPTSQKFDSVGHVSKGRLDITWRACMGERARIQVSQPKQQVCPILI